MIRLATVLWIIVLSVSAFGLYKVKFQVQTLRAHIADVSREIERERESMNVVAAEWAYLNRPERLKKLSDTYLSSSAVTVEQIADVQAIPFPQVQQAQAPAPATTPNTITPVSQKTTTTPGEAE